MIYTTDLGEKLQRELAIAKEHKIPMLLDDAAGIPPADNAKLYARMGIDLYCFSGGKGLCGPQCSGLLLGRKDLIEAALLNSSPREGAVCRPMKVGKEEVIGCLTALETWLKSGREETLRRMERPCRSHSEAGRDGPGREDGHLHSRRWQPLSDAESLMGSAGLAIQHHRLRAGVARGRSCHRSARSGQSKPGDGGSRRESESKRTQGTRPHRTGFHDHQAGRGNHCRTKTARDSGRRPEKIRG